MLKIRKRGEDMEITIKAEPKEIASLMAMLQEEQTEIIAYPNGKEIHRKTNPVRNDTEIRNGVAESITETVNKAFKEIYHTDKHV